jgi:hypothetical protein
LVDVQKVGGAAIRAEVPFGDLEADARGIGMMAAASFMATTNPSASGNCSTNASVRCVVNVAIPHWRGK